MLIMQENTQLFYDKVWCQRPLQDKHSEICIQCSVCRYVLNRRNMNNSCNVNKQDMKFVEDGLGYGVMQPKGNTDNIH